MTGAAFDREGETMADLLIKNAQLVDCDGRERGDLLIRDGKIAAVAGEIAAECAVRDAQGMTVTPIQKISPPAARRPRPAATAR